MLSRLRTLLAEVEEEEIEGEIKEEKGEEIRMQKTYTQRNNIKSLNIHIIKEEEG